MAQVQCPVCGSMVPEQVSVCPNCGATLNQTVSPSVGSEQQVQGTYKYDKKKAATLFFCLGFPGYFYLRKWGMGILCIILMIGLIPIIIGIIKGIQLNKMSDYEFHRLYE